MVTIIKNGNIVTGDQVFQGDIKVQDETMIEIGFDIDCPHDKYIDASGCYVLPGAIDAHTHFDLDTGLTKTADDFESGSRAALAGGTTTIIDFATQEKGKTLKEAVAVWDEKSKGKTYCDYGYHMAITDWNECTKKEMRDMVEHGIPTFKMYMAYKNTMQVDDAIIYEALRESNQVGALIGFHCENGYLIDERVKEFIRNGKTTPYYHMESRLPEVEAEAIYRLLTIGKLAKAPVWIVHLSTKEGLAFVEQARAQGQKVIAETCPQYLMLTRNCYGTPEGTDFETAKYVMSPPLREKEDQEALWKGLQNRSLDFVTTDHCSFHIKGQKDLGKDDFSKIPNGGPGVEDRVLMLYTYGVCQNRLTIQEMVMLLAGNPAELLGLHNKGKIEVGKDADIVILDPNSTDIFSVATQTQRVDYNAYEGIKRCGRIETVLLRGKVVVSDHMVLAQPASGSFQRREIQPVRM